MANWYGTCRSNYFAVKDPEAFKEYIHQFKAKVIEKDGLYGFYSECYDGGLPYLFDDNTDDDDLGITDIREGLSAHLQEHSICVVLEVGAERARYATGWAEAISHTGEKVKIDINSIYKLAQETFGSDVSITEAIY